MDEFKKNLRQSFGFRLFIYLISLLVCTIVAEGLVMLLSAGNNINLLKIGQGIGSILMFIVPPLILYGVTRTQPLRALGFKPINDVWVLLLGLALMFVSLPVTNQLTTWNEVLRLPAAFEKIEAQMQQMEEMAGDLTERMLQVDTIGGLLFNLLIIALIPAIGEELTFRSVIQQGLVKVFKNPHVGIVLAAAIFSFIHFQFYGFFPRMFLGILLGYLFYYSGSVWVSILMHFINNGSAVLIAYLEYKGLTETSADEFGATDNIILIIASFVLTVAIVWLVGKRSRKLKIEN